jgi:molybdopterin-containing oxidoreductase family membrane subunit
VYGLEAFVTERHLDNMAKLLLATGLLVGYSYVMESFMGWLSGDVYASAASWQHMTGPYAPIFFLVLACNVLVPQALWSRRMRTRPLPLFGIALVALVGMWVERFMIVVTPLSRDRLPSSWGHYVPTVWDYAALAGTIGLFFFLFLLFLRVLPMISIYEMRELVDKTQKEAP